MAIAALAPASAQSAAAQLATAAPLPTSSPTPAPAWLPLVRHDGPPAMRADVVLLVDVSETTAAGDLQAVRAALAGLIDRADPARDQFAIIAFDDAPHAVTRLTGDRAALREGLSALRPGGGSSRYDLAMRAARHELLDFELERRNWENRGVVVMVVSGAHDGPANDAIAEAFFTGNAGFAVYAVGVGPHADEALLRAMADRRGYLGAPDASAASDALDAIGRRLLTP